MRSTVALPSFIRRARAEAQMPSLMLAVDLLAPRLGTALPGSQTRRLRQEAVTACPTFKAPSLDMKKARQSKGIQMPSAPSVSPLSDMRCLHSTGSNQVPVPVPNAHTLVGCFRCARRG